jgi:outer membrane protein assembly factor BamB
MDSAWPMHGHDVKHTGLSPYSTANNPGEEKWWNYLDSFVEGSPIVDKDGIIYFGSWDNYLYALYPNGSLKWKSNIEGDVETYPAIAEDGTIYVGTVFSPAYGTYLFAINPDGTRKWKYKTGEMYSSPTIGDDGTVYCSDGNKNIIALYPNNGTLKWKYTTGSTVMSSPAIDKNGIIYCGSNDDNIYALYPNGTLKWKYNTGSWVHGIPTIADDGIVYCGSDNGYMYAFYPNNGTVKWSCKIGDVWGSPTLDKDGNLYVGVWQKKFYSIYTNGTIRWSVNLSRRIWGQSAVVSDDGIIYFGTCDFESHDGGFFHALNPDGTTKYILDYIEMFWASPAIGEDGTVYICTRGRKWSGTGYPSIGFLRALGELDPDAPLKPVIDGPKIIDLFKEYKYRFKATSPLGKDVYLWIEWGDKGLEEWIGPYASGQEITLSHEWVTGEGLFEIRVKAKDVDDRWGCWGVYEYKIKTKSIDNSLLLRFLEQYPLLNRLLQCIIKY